MLKLKPFTLLYAEDDSSIRQGYIKYFKTIFKEVYEASDGKEAYILYQKLQPDILLFDINMPYINGLELIEKIRQTNKKIKIMILSAHVEEEKLMRAIPLGLSNYLKKPVKKRDLEAELLKIIAQLESEKSQIIYFDNNVHFNKENNQLIDNSIQVHLTRNEIILINLLTSKCKNEYSIEDILDEFWHMSSQNNMSHDAVRNTIKRLKSKLPHEAMKNNYGLGYKLLIKT